MAEAAAAKKTHTTPDAERELTDGFNLIIDALKLIIRLVNIGDARSLACHPASTTHRQMNEAALAKAGVDLPVEIDLELEKYLNDRGETKVQFMPEQVIADPFGNQVRFNSKSMPAGVKTEAPASRSQQGQ